jgi:hypothetical protein
VIIKGSILILQGVCLELEIQSFHKVMGPSQSPLYRSRCEAVTVANTEISQMASATQLTADPLIC